MKLKPTARRKSYYGTVQPNQVICKQFEETHGPQRNYVATTINFFTKVSPVNLAESENLVEAA